MTAKLPPLTMLLRLLIPMLRCRLPTYTSVGGVQHCAYGLISMAVPLTPCSMIWNL